MRSNRGTTIVELMVVVGVLSIILSIAIPNLRQWIANMQVRTKAEAILNGMQLARGEALRRNARVMLTVAADSSWTIGCETAVAADNDGDGLPDCPATIQQKAAGEGGTGVTIALTPANAVRATFSGVGMVVANADATATLTQMDFSSSSASKAYSVRLTAGGQSRICDPSVTDAAKSEKC